MKKTIALFGIVALIAFTFNVAISNRGVPKTEKAFSISSDVQVASITSNNLVNLVYNDYLNAEVYVATVTYHLESPRLLVKEHSNDFVKPVSIEEHRKPPKC